MYHDGHCSKFTICSNKLAQIDLQSQSFLLPGVED